MIKHIVIFKLTPPFTRDEKREKVARLHEIFAPLGSMLDWIREYKTGTNILDADHAGDFVIDSLFDSADDLKRYQESTEHREAVARASVIDKTKMTVDYYIE